MSSEIKIFSGSLSSSSLASVSELSIFDFYLLVLFCMKQRHADLRFNIYFSRWRRVVEEIEMKKTFPIKANSQYRRRTLTFLRSLSHTANDLFRMDGGVEKICREKAFRQCWTSENTTVENPETCLSTKRFFGENTEICFEAHLHPGNKFQA